MIWLALAATLVSNDPPIRLTLSDQTLAPGDRVKVRVRLDDEGYLVVLRADVHGRIRVLYPIDPADSAPVKGGRDLAILDRSGREGFRVEDRAGSGFVLAARADTPFDFQAFTRGAHWDYRALAATDSSVTGEDALVDVLGRMATSDYDYDVATYAVSARGHAGYHGGFDAGYHGGSRTWISAGVVISWHGAWHGPPRAWPRPSGSPARYTPTRHRYRRR